jgi:hypothetical protein
MPRGLQEVEAPRISRKSANEGCKVVSPTHRSRLYTWHLTLEAQVRSHTCVLSDIADHFKEKNFHMFLDTFWS